MKCSACSGSLKETTREGVAVYVCRRCEGVHSFSMYLGDSYRVVLPYFDTVEPEPEALRYFDLTCVGSEGVTRRHGWYNPATRRVVQIG